MISPTQYVFMSACVLCLQPLHIEVSESLVTQVNDLLAASANRSENESVLRSMFDECRAALSGEISEQLADFRNKRDLGMGVCPLIVTFIHFEMSVFAS